MSAPREHPMLFSGPMVRALLRDAAPKTVTRRLINPRSAYFGSAEPTFWDHCAMDRAWVDGKGSTEEYLHVPCHRGDAGQLERLDKVWGERGLPNSYREQFPDCGPCEVCDHWGWRMTAHRLWARIRLGDRIWVREAFAPVRFPGKPCVGIHYAAGPAEADWIHRVEAGKPYLFPEGAGVADERWPEGFRYPWRSPVFLPRWASRLTLEVLSVKAERLQDITEEEAIREGVEPFSEAYSGISLDQRLTTGERAGDEPFRASFALRWDELNGGRATWKSNPLVWRYEFRRTA